MKEFVEEFLAIRFAELLKQVARRVRERRPETEKLLKLLPRLNFNQVSCGLSSRHGPLHTCASLVLAQSTGGPRGDVTARRLRVFGPGR